MVHIRRIIIITIFAIILSTKFVLASNTLSDETLEHIVEATELSDEQVKGIREEVGKLFDTYEITDVYKINDNAYYVTIMDENQSVNSLIVVETSVDGSFHYEIIDNKQGSVSDIDMQEYIVKVYDELEKIVSDIETGNAEMVANASEEKEINVILVLVGVAFGVFLTLLAGIFVYNNYRYKDDNSKK